MYTRIISALSLMRQLTVQDLAGRISRGLEGCLLVLVKLERVMAVLEAVDTGQGVEAVIPIMEGVLTNILVPLY